jgi:hypothetical protein
MPISAHRSFTFGGTFRKAVGRSPRLYAVLASGTLAILSIGGMGRSANAQGVNIAIVPPPPIRELRDPKEGAAGGQPIKFTQAKQQFVTPERAYDQATGQSLRWDCTLKNWIDTKTDKPVGFQGGKARDGEVVPPPPKLVLPDSERVTSEGLFAKLTQATQNPDNPERAYDATSDRLLAWDRGQKTWMEPKTGEAVGFLGRKGPSSCPQTTVVAKPDGSPSMTISSNIVRDLLFGDQIDFDPLDSTPAAIAQSLLQIELIFTSKPSLIGGALQFVGPTQQAIASDGTSRFLCSACAGEAACLSLCPDFPFSSQSRGTVSATLAGPRSAMR